MCEPVHGLSTTNHPHMESKTTRGGRSKGHPLPPKIREKLTSKAMHLSRNIMFLMPVLGLLHQLFRPGDGERWT
jgi:hypothetical protein